MTKHRARDCTKLLREGLVFLNASTVASSALTYLTASSCFLVKAAASVLQISVAISTFRLSIAFVRTFVRATFEACAFCKWTICFSAATMDCVFSLRFDTLAIPVVDVRLIVRSLMHQLGLHLPEQIDHLAHRKRLSFEVSKTVPPEDIRHGNL